MRCDGSGYAGRARVESLTEEQAVAVCAAASELRARSCAAALLRARRRLCPTDWVRVTVCVSERLPRIACRSTASRRAAGEYGVEFRSMWFELAWPKHGSTYTQGSPTTLRHHTQPRLNPRVLQDLSRAFQTLPFSDGSFACLHEHRKGTLLGCGLADRCGSRGGGCLGLAPTARRARYQRDGARGRRRGRRRSTGVA